MFGEVMADLQSLGFFPTCDWKQNTYIYLIQLDVREARFQDYYEQ